MKNSSLLYSILAVVLLAIAIPVFFVRDSYSLSQDDHDTILMTTHQFLDNPFERMLVLKTVVDGKDGEKIHTSAYTFFGLKYATVEADFAGNGAVTWRRWFNGTPVTSTDDPAPGVTPQRGSLTGTFVCLPHKDTTGPQTLECAFGLKTAEGLYYAVDFSLMSQLAPGVTDGDTFSANGLITPIEMLSSDHWQKYPIKGIFSVTDSVKIISTTRSVSLNETVSVANISLTPTAVLEDSRCPVDVQCIQAGTVRLVVRAGGDLVAPATLTLGKPTTILGHVVELVSVQPEKHSQKTIAPSDYLFTIAIKL